MSASLEEAGEAKAVALSEVAARASDEPVYCDEEERRLVERLRDLGYE